jgi:tRNA threonylcarbamoyladenosine biosynthesis protein TsaB
MLAVGDGAVRHRALLDAAGLDVPPDADPRHRVAGPPLVRLAAAGTPVAAATLVPDYVRLPDAELHRRRVAADP